MTDAGRFQLRVVASEYAAMTKQSCALGGEVVVQASAPILISSLLSPDLRAIWFDFDQSVEGPNECDKIFSTPSLKLLGQGVACEFSGARLVAKLGKKPTIQSGGKVQIVVENGIRRAGTVDADTAQTLTGVFASVTLHPAAVAVPRYRIIPSNPTCDTPGASNSVAEIRIVPEDGRELNASMRVSFNKGNDIQHQRRNLFLWRTIREMGDQLVRQQKEGSSNRLVINSSLLVPNVEYRITVWAVDMMGTQGEEREVLVQTDQQSGKQQPTQLIILGPETTRVDVELRAEAKLETCDPRAAPPAKIKFFWGVLAAGGPLPIKTSQQGRVLRLPPFSMKGGVPHQISCSAYLESDLSLPLATGTLVVLTTSAGVEARVSTTAVSIGTNQELILDGSKSADLDAYPGPLQFAWECVREGTACLLPRAGPTLLRNVYKQELSRSILRLPPGALAVGEHTFTLRVSRPASGNLAAISSRTEVKVRVLRGSSPSIRLLKTIRQPVDPTASTQVHALLEGLRGRCWAKWRSAAKAVGEVPLDLDQSPTMWEENSDRESNREFVLTLAAGKLTAGAYHRIVLDAACSQTPDKPALNRASLELEFKVATVPSPPTISVHPLFGEALQTLFTISVETEGATTLRSGTEQPGRLLYEFGWREAGKTKIQSLQTSLYDLSAQTLLHCEGGAGECSVVPVVKVCDSQAVCSSSEAVPVRVSKPTTISQYNLDLTANKIEELLDARRVGSAFTLSRGAILTVRDVPGTEQAAHQLSQRVKTSFARTISDMERRLESGNANAMLQMLDGENFSLLQHEPLPLSTIAAALDTFSERISTAINSRAPKVIPRRFMASVPSPPTWPNPRRKRQEESDEQNNIGLQEVSKSVREAEEAIFRLNISDRAEAASLLGHRLGSFLRSLCAGPSGTTLRARLVTLATAALPQEERLRVPLPRNHAADGQINSDQREEDEEESAAYVQVFDVNSETETDEPEEACLGVTLTADADVASVFAADNSRMAVVLQVHEFQHRGRHNARELQIDIPLDDTTDDPHQIWMCARWNVDNPVGQWLTNECQSLSTQPARLTCLCPLQSGSYSAVLTTVHVDEPENEQPHAAHEQIHQQVDGPPSETTTRAAADESVRTSQTEKLHLDEADKQDFLQHLVFMQNEDKRPNPIFEVPQQPEGPHSQRLSSNLITFTVLSDLAAAAQFQPTSDLEARIKKQMAKQLNLPELMIAECTAERGTISVRFSHPREEIVNRAVKDLVRLLKLGRLDLKGLDNERLRIPPQAVPGYQFEEGGNSFTPGPSGPVTDTGTTSTSTFLPPTTRSTFTFPPETPPPTIPTTTTETTTTPTTTAETITTPSTTMPTTTTESTTPSTTTEMTTTTSTTTPSPTIPSTEMTTTLSTTNNQNPAGGPDPKPGFVPGAVTTVAGPESTSTTTTTQRNVAGDAEWVEADVYDENLIKADQNMMYGVYAGAGVSVLILLVVILKSCIDLFMGKPVDWGDLPGNGQEIPDEKMRKTAADDAPLYRPIQYPDEIQAALAQVNSNISVQLGQTALTGSEYDPAEYIDSTLPGRPYRVQ
ncbi:Hypothetical predicted protein [Cloeon dipterum]|nr:Hypothetical predicted protein [Cloeon dipterum]